MSDLAFDPEYAVRVLQSVLAQPGGAETVIVQLGALPGAQYVPAQPKKFLRPAQPSRLVLADQGLHAAAARLQLSHIVRGVALQTRAVGPAEAAQALVAGLQELVRTGGPEIPDAVNATLYGLEVAAGPG